MMKKQVTKAASLFAAVMLLFCACAFAKTDIPQATDNFFVNDFANVLDNDTENYIFEKSRAYNNDGGPQVVVLTMNTIDGENVEEFSIETARQWGIGDKESDNGILILLVMDSRDIRVEVGYGLEGILNDGKCGRFIRDAAPMLSDGDYSGGIKHLYDDIISELESPSDEENEDDTGIGTIVLIFIIIFFCIIASKNNRRRGRFGGGSFGNGSSSGGSFFGGGSSFGGGGSSGGGFSGGGGSFGGGGASGKF